VRDIMTETKKNLIKKAAPVKTLKKEVIKKEVVKKEHTVAEIKKSNEKKVAIKSAVEKKETIKIVPDKNATVKATVKITPKSSKKDSDSTYATGKRKNAIAKLWLKKGSGKIIVNGKPAGEYLKRAILNVIIGQPFSKTDTVNKFDVECDVCGGGLTGQAGAIKHAISKALNSVNPELRKPLKSAGFLTRDSRVVERKKAGLKKARKGQVFQKR